MAPPEFITSVATIKTYASDQVEDAQRVTWRARPSGVVYSLLFAPYPTDPQGTVIWTGEAIAQQGEYWQDQWNTNASLWYVLNIATTQDINISSDLEDVAIVTVRSTSGKSTTQVTVPVQSWPVGAFEGYVTPFVTALDRAEGYTG